MSSLSLPFAILFADQVCALALSPGKGTPCKMVYNAESKGACKNSQRGLPHGFGPCPKTMQFHRLA